MANKTYQTINDEIQEVTINHYDFNAESFWQGTRDHDVSQNINAFLQALPKDKVLDILDFGCGPGRDLEHFKRLGHQPIGLDGSKTFCTMAQKYSGCTVLNQDFLNLKLAPESFDGIYANASMFHIPSQELPNVLTVCHRALKPKGILFTSNPRGNAEGWQGERYGHYMEFERSKLYLEQAGFRILDHYYRPQGKPKHEQPWLAIICQRL